MWRVMSRTNADINTAAICTGGNRTMVAAATMVIMAAAKKAQQNVFDLYHSYNRTISWDSSGL